MQGPLSSQRRITTLRGHTRHGGPRFRASNYVASTSQVAACAALTFAACASIEPTRGHREIAELVQQRAGFTTHWQDPAHANAEVRRLIEQKFAAGLTIDGAVEIAVANNPDLQALYESVGVAQADLLQAGLLTNPTLGLSVGFPLNNRGTFETEFSLVQELVQLVLLPTRKRLAEQQFSAVIQTIAHDALRVVAETRRVYLSLAAAERLLDVRRSATEAARISAEFTTQLHTAGNINDAAWVWETANYEQMKFDLAADELALQSHREELARQLGLEAGDVARYLATPLVSALEELPSTEPPAHQVESLALTQRLDIDAARRWLSLSEQAVSLARTTRWFGKMELGAHLHQDPNGPSLLGPTLTLDLPIFDQRQAYVARLEAEKRQAEKRLLALSVDARSHARLSLARVQALRKMVVQLRDQLLPLRERVVKETLLQYNAMRVSLPQILDMKQKQLEAYRSYIEYLRDYWIERAELERIVGGKLDASNSTTPAAGTRTHNEAGAP